MLQNRRTLVMLLAVFILVAAAGYYYYNGSRPQAQQPEEPTITTAQVRRGDLTVTASGSGTLVPGYELDLGFRSAGVLAELYIQVGDQVQAGDALARLDDTTAQLQAAQSQIALELAELKLAELVREPTEAELVLKQENLAAAQLELEALLSKPTAEELTIAEADLQKARLALQKAQAAYDRVASRPDIAALPQASALEQATLDYQKAEAAYKQKVAGATEGQLASARAKVAQAQQQLDDLLSGPTAEALESAQLQVEQARNNLLRDQEQLANTTLSAPVAGTVVAIKGDVGESVGTNPIITLADMETPQVLFWVEETDLASVAPGNRVNVVFEALPDRTFPGQIISVDPALVTVSNTSAVQAWASVDLNASPIKLLSGMNADVEIVAGEARNVLLVPAQALRELGPDQYAVFVAKPDGELELRLVQVGLQDFVYAEIRSGLQEGDVIKTGETQSSEPSSASPDQQEPGALGGFMRFLGGGGK